ncbi:tetratricopeptide repeat protein [Sandaracinus amylolyticus]|uniref:Uncharacterized protein n=1 Tax=Sandaracinus amylolyticus TaxID=927083 RepID=A0A0F6W4H2_9BACT|nr:tetratricopeptide repeat protein [Sandaracinus amylolyticus]AKF07192.1 Hypothetical protein DB32_004341 [Sandaracinus amylolyticus]
MRRALVTSAFALACLALASSSARAETLDDLFRAGNEAYFRGAYDDAAERYEELVELGVRDADVFYNLGTAYAREGRHGRAIAAYERALRVRPSDSEASRALQHARDALASRRADREGEATMASDDGLAHAVFGRLSRDALAGAVLVLDALFFAVLAAFLFVRRETARLALGIGAPLLGIALGAASLGLAIRSGAFDEGAPAVVIEDRVALREGPHEDAQERGRAREGERAWIVGEDGAWLRVRAGAHEGWVEGAKVVRLD